MKILYVIDHLRHDGTQRMLFYLIEGLSSRNHQQAVLSLNYGWDNELVEELKKLNIEIRFIQTIAFFSGYGLISAWRWMRSEQFDAVVTLLFVSDVVGRILARTARIQHILSSIRARNINYQIWKRWLVRFTMRWVDAVVINSARIREFVLSEEGVPGNKIFIIPNGVKVENYCNSIDRDGLRKEMGFNPQDFVIGSVGRLHEQKGYDILLKAIALLPQEDIHLLLIGEGEEITNLRNLSQTLELHKRVHFAGYRRDVPMLLKILDLYSQPSRYEGMPNALMEAMASGCPIVASSVDGICELIKDNVHGWLVPPDDIHALAEVIQFVLDNRTEANLRGIAAHNRAMDSYSVEAMVAAWEKVLLQIKRGKSTEVEFSQS